MNLRYFRLLIAGLALCLGLGALSINTVYANIFEASTPTSDFTDNGDGTVTHKTTGLTWKRCGEGQFWNGSTCTGVENNYTWAQATALTSTFAGKSDWRLPSVRELLTIVEMDAVNPAINSTIFPHMTPTFFWTSTSVAGKSGYAWYVTFDTGDADPAGATTNHFPVRLVRGSVSSLLSPGRATSDYSSSYEGIVTHIPTALIWKRCAEGQTWFGGTCGGTPTAFTWADASALTGTFAGKSGWRLPTQQELLSLTDYTLAGLTINSTVFPNVYPTSFWSATPYAGDSGRAWQIGFANGDPFPPSKSDTSNKFYVRLVCAGASCISAPSLTGFTFNNCPTTSLKPGDLIPSCTTGTATYSDGSSKQVTVTSQISGPINQGGSGTQVAGNAVAGSIITITATYTETGVTKTATTTITVAAAAASLTGLTISCSNEVAPSSGGTCSSTARYSDGASKAVSPVWSSSNTTLLRVTGNGNLGALLIGNLSGPSTDTPVTITATYTENGTTQTTSATVTVKAAAATLSSLTISCPSVIASSSSGNCEAHPLNSDGSSHVGSSGSYNWTSSIPSVLSVGNSFVLAGNLQAQSVTTDTPVIITATYTDNGITVTANATVTVKVGAVPVSTGTECLFNWAEKNYPELFSPSGATSKSFDIYYYRYYSKQKSYLAISSVDNHLYYAGPLSDNGILDVGPQSKWLTTAGCQ